MVFPPKFETVWLNFQNGNRTDARQQFRRFSKLEIIEFVEFVAMTGFEAQDYRNSVEVAKYLLRGSL